MRLAIVADGDPTAWSTNSGVARNVIDALARRTDVEVAVAVDGSLQGLSRLLAAVLSFRPSRARWRAEFTKGRVATRLRTRRVRRALDCARGSIDLCIIVRNLYGPLPVPYVVFLDQTAVIAQREWGEWALPTRALKWRIAADRAQFQNALMIATAGGYVRRSVIDDYGIDAAKVFAVGGGARVPDAGDLPHPERYNSGVCLFVGREAERKGLDILVDAFSIVRETLPYATLWVAGTSLPAASPPGVEMKGVGLAREDIDALYRGAAVFCIPSRYEPFGLVALEAMAWQLPVIATRQGAFPEILGGGVGVMVNRESAGELAVEIVRLLEHPDHAEALGVRARRRVVQTYTWDNVVDKLVRGVATVNSGAGR